MPSGNDVATPNAPHQNWSTATHDTAPPVEFWINPLETSTYLAAFLEAEGEDYAPPYEPIREAIREEMDSVEARARPGQTPRDDVGDSRLRTWKKVFENLGIIRVDGATRTIDLTPLGRAIRRLRRTLDSRIEGANDQLARLAVNSLARHLLRNPVDSAEYPEGTDVRPYRLMWKAMRALDDKLHWEEMNRVLMRVNYTSEEAAAIEKIREVRQRVGGLYTADDVDQLGSPTVTETNQERRRITPWFTEAGFGGLLLDDRGQADGYWGLVEKYKPLIDDALSAEVAIPEGAETDKEIYLDYISAVEEAEDEVSDEDRSAAEGAVAALRKYGSSRIVCLSGLPGTGKSRLAEQVARVLTDGDTYRSMEIQFHESTTYDDFVEGYVPTREGGGFERVPKTLRVINRRALLDPDERPYVLVIEELTRANVHAVLGELITYVEHRNRKFRLALSQEEIEIAPNLYFLATMNPRDRSALKLDDAIRRRLYLIPVGPSTDALRSMLDGELDPALLDRLADWFDTHKDALPFGHGIFAGVRDAADLREVWEGTASHFLTDIEGNVRPDYTGLADAYPWR